MINIAYSGNKKVFKGILLSCMSMIKTCKQPIKVFVMSMDLTDQDSNFEIISGEQIQLLDRVLKEVNPSSEAVIVDVGKVYRDEFLNSKNKNTEYTPYTLNRLFMDILDEMPDKVAYLDVDTMLVNDVSELYDINMDDYEFGAALDFMGKFWISPTYTNAGVMLINVKKVRETGMMVKCRELIKTKWMKMPDQTAANKSVKYKKYLDGKFNEQRGIKPDTVVKHFCKGIKWTPFFHIYNVKQWEIDKVHKLGIHDFDDIYEIYLDLVKKYDFI